MIYVYIPGHPYIESTTVLSDIFIYLFILLNSFSFPVYRKELNYYFLYLEYLECL